MAGRKTIHETPFHRLAGKIARTPVAQRKTAVLGWLAGQGNDRAYLLGRDPIRPAATRRITQTVRHRPANTVPRTPAPESHRARQALTVLRQIPSLSAVPSIPRPSPKSNTMRARIASCCGVKDARIRRSSPSRSSSLNSILAALRPISSLHREIIATENQTTENKSLICESELTPTCTRSRSRARSVIRRAT